MPRYIDDRSHDCLFVTGSLDSLLAPDSFVRVLWAAVSDLDFSAFDAVYRNDNTGRPAVDPRRLAAVWILGLLRGVTSSVALALRCKCDLEFRWLLGDAPVEKSTLCSFRKDHADALKDLSTQVLAALARAQMLPARELVQDGTIIQAAASCGANVTRKQLKKRVERLERLIEERLAQAEGAEGEGGAPVEALRERQARFEAALAEMTALGLTQETDRYTQTEPEASLKKLKHGGYAPAHNVQVVADAASGALVVVAPVDQGNDQGLLQVGVEAAQAELARVAALLEGTPEAAKPGPVSAVAADGAYHDTLQLVELEAQAIAVVVPDGQGARQAPDVQPGFEAAAFAYDPATDTMTCPQGQPLPRAGRNDGGTAARYRAPAATCRACACKQACCPKAQAHGRTVHRPLYAQTLKAVARRVASAEGQASMHRRQVTGEGAFARLVERLHWRRCRTWGGAGVQAEGLWRQIAHNLMLLTGAWKPLVFHSEVTEA